MPVDGKLTPKEIKEIVDFQHHIQEGVWVWHKRLSLMPLRECYYSKRWIWPFTFAYEGRRNRHFIFLPARVVETRWISKDEFIIQKLKGNIWVGGRL